MIQGKELLSAIELLSIEKRIDTEEVLEALETALKQASIKVFKDYEVFDAMVDREDGSISVFGLKRVVSEITKPKREIGLDDAAQYGEVEEGDVLQFPLDEEALGRIAAHTTKQVLLNRVREAERRHIADDYEDRVGEVVSALVRRVERDGSVIMELDDHNEAILRRREQSKGENLRNMEEVKVVIVGVNSGGRDPLIEISRNDPRLFISLFEREVPEIHDSIVVIKNAAREAGERAKISVYSLDSNIDPVGACVGVNGSRVKAIMRELRKERIDIIEYAEDICVYAKNALAPARINRVGIVDPEDRMLEVVVDEDQLSLAIGKERAECSIGFPFDRLEY